ncbi:MAG: c-di-GMP-binding flagellar brake protein YcgR [Lysobacterales bacterium]|jgi:c-di-GMP-binding flagellar brake protein YcgR
MSNDRKAKRVSCLVPVDGQESGLFSQTRTVDFSETGIGFVSKREIPLNHEITIELDLGADEDPAFVVGIVKWVEKMDTGDYRIGLHFKDVMDGSKTRLNQYFSKQ